MIEIHIQTTAKYLENLSNQLLLLGTEAITWLDAANQPIYEPAPGELIPWQEVTIVALFTPNQPIAEICQYLTNQQNSDLLQHYKIVTVPSKDWVRESLDQFYAMAFGKRLWIVPSWQTPPDATATNILIDPGLAFGTGTHATTALCLEWLDEHIKGNETIIDYGCGSGILAIAAAKLGAKEITAIDYDPQALEACHLNAKLNQVEQQIIITDSIKTNVTADIIIANILAKTIIQLKSRLLELLKTNGYLVLSGILAEQSDEVITAFQSTAQLREVKQKQEWIRLVLQKQ